MLPLPRDRAGRKIKLGPPLNGIDGRKSGTSDGFNYSPANKSSGITWSEETFPKYIRAPMQEMPGTRMAFVGIKNDKTLQTSGPISSSSGLMGQRNETRPHRFTWMRHRAKIRVLLLEIKIPPQLTET